MSAAAFTATVKLVEITSPSRSSYFIKALYLCQFVVCKKSIWRNDADLNCKIIWIQQDLGQANWIRILTHPSKVIRQKFKSPPPLRWSKERESVGLQDQLGVHSVPVLLLHTHIFQPDIHSHIQALSPTYVYRIAYAKQMHIIPSHTVQRGFLCELGGWEVFFYVVLIPAISSCKRRRRKWSAPFLRGFFPFSAIGNKEVLLLCGYSHVEVSYTSPKWVRIPEPGPTQSRYLVIRGATQPRPNSSNAIIKEPYLYCTYPSIYRSITLWLFLLK